MIEHLSACLKKHQGEYKDIRWEERQLTRIVCSHRETKSIGSSIMKGGSIRVLNRGALASCVISDLSAIDSSLDWCLDASSAIADSHATPVRYAPCEPCQDKITISPEVDPRTISLSEKKSLVDSYRDLILSSPGIQTCQVAYRENAMRKYFVNSEGTQIDQDNLLVRLNCVLVARKNDVVQTMSIAFGGGTDYQRLLNRHEDLKKKLAIAYELLDAEPISAGIYTAVLDNEITGVFAHEAFGHLSEADIVLRNRELKEKMYLGRKMGNPILTISDDPTLSETPGYFRYDDDGVPATKTYLIKDGILAGRLHSRETAAEFGEPLSGNSRAADHSYSPAVRMSNIFIEPRENSPESLISSVKKGIYLCGIRGGQTIGDQFSFGAEYAYLIENGKLSRMVRDLNISGNLFTTLENIVGIGNDLKISERGGCGKGTGEGIQMLDKSGIGGPHIMIKGVTIGGTV